MTRSEEDESLVRASLAGDSASFGVLVGRYQDRLFATLLRITGHREDACELIQESFLRAYKMLPRFRGNSQFSTWIYRIAVNLAISERRKRRSAVSRVLSPRELTFDPADDASETSALEGLELQERNETIQRVLNTLQPDHRAVVVMKEYDGLRYEQIAEILEIPVGTVRSRLFRARAELRVLLGDLMHDEEPVPAARMSGHER